MTKLGDVTVLYTGTGFPKDLQGKKSGRYPFYKVGDISKNVLNGYRRLALCDNYLEDEDVGKIKGCILPKDTVVFAKIGEAVKLNRRAITTQDCLVDNNVMGIAPVKSVIDIDYLYYYMCSIKLDKFAEATTVPSVKKALVEKLKINLPDLVKQKKIVKVISRVDDLIQLNKKQLMDLDVLIKSRFIEMFGDEFIEVTADSVCSKIVDCPHSTPQYNEDSLIYPAIRTSEIQNGKIKWSTMKYVGSKEYEKRIKRLKPLAGDIVYAREGTYGDCVILPRGFEFCLGQRTMLFRPDFSICNSEYLHTVLRSEFVKKQADKSNAGSTVPHVNVADAKQFRFPLPPIELQNQFASFVTQVDKSKLAVQKSLDELETLKKSLMQQYFS